MIRSELVSKYETDGFAGPFAAFDQTEMQSISIAVQQELRLNGSAFSSKRNRHLDWEIVKHLVESKAVISAATDILGPELVLWRTQFFVSEMGAGLRWHQDEYKALLSDPAGQLSMHLGITEATPDNCLMLVPGSHRMNRAQLADIGFNHIEGSDQNTYGTPNFWRKTERSANVQKMLLKPGEFFVFHPMLLHASYDLTQSPDTPRHVTDVSASENRVPRIGLGIRITTTHNTILAGAFSETAERGDRSSTLTAGGSWVTSARGQK